MSDKITPREAADILECNIRTIHRWCKETVSGCPNALLKKVTRKTHLKVPRYELDREEIQSLLNR